MSSGIASAMPLAVARRSPFFIASMPTKPLSSRTVRTPSTGATSAAQLSGLAMMPEEFRVYAQHRTLETGEAVCTRSCGRPAEPATRRRPSWPAADRRAARCAACPPPSRIVITPACTSTNVAPCAISCPGATSLAARRPGETARNRARPAPLPRRADAHCRWRACLRPWRSGARELRRPAPPAGPRPGSSAAGSAGAVSGMRTGRRPGDHASPTRRSRRPATPARPAARRRPTRASAMRSSQGAAVARRCACAAGRSQGRRYNRRAPLSRTAHLNPRLALLQPYPFEKLRALVSGVTPNPARAAHQSVPGRAQAPDAARGDRRTQCGRGRARELSHDDRRRRAARRDRRLARAPPRAAGARSGHASAARARQPRSAVRVRADGARRQPRRRHRRRPQSVLPDLRRRRAARRRAHPLRERESRDRVRARLGGGARTKSGRAHSSCTCARPTIRRAACSTSRAGANCSRSRTGTVS